MIVQAIEIERFGPIKRFGTVFARDNCIIGTNGCGKTHLLGLIAGLCGTDSATSLVKGMDIGKVRLTLLVNGSGVVFETTDRLDPEQIAEFKSALPKRVNFPLTEWSRVFASHCCDIVTARDRFFKFIDEHNDARWRRPTDDLFSYNARSGRAAFLAGDGHTHAMRLFLNDSIDGVPTLLDNPSRHLDVIAKRRIVGYLTRRERQILYTTHDPEMVLHDAWDISDGAQKIVDLSESR